MEGVLPAEVLDDVGADYQPGGRAYRERPADDPLRRGYLLPGEGVGDYRQGQRHYREPDPLDGPREEQEVYRGREAGYSDAECVESKRDQDHPLLPVCVSELPEERCDRAPHYEEGRGYPGSNGRSVVEKSFCMIGTPGITMVST